MNTRFRRSLQAAALLFSLTLFIGYLWSTIRQAGPPIFEAFQLANDSYPESLVVITMATNPDGTKRPVVLGTKSMGGTPVVRINLTPEEQIEHAEMLKPFLSSTSQNIGELITIEPSTGGEFEDFMNGVARHPDGSVTSFFMPGSKNISQPVFSSRKGVQHDSPPAPIMPSSKRGIFALPSFSFDSSIHQNSLMGGSKSAPVFGSRPSANLNSVVPEGTIKAGKPTNEIHRTDPP